MKEALGMALILGGYYPSNCPICKQAFEGDDKVHAECLRQKHGGTLPDGFEKLIEMFELEPSKAIAQK